MKNSIIPPTNSTSRARVLHASRPCDWIEEVAGALQQLSRLVTSSPSCCEQLAAELPPSPTPAVSSRIWPRLSLAAPDLAAPIGCAVGSDSHGPRLLQNHHSEHLTYDSDSASITMEQQGNHCSYLQLLFATPGLPRRHTTYLSTASVTSQRPRPHGSSLLMRGVSVSEVAGQLWLDRCRMGLTRRDGVEVGLLLIEAHQKNWDLQGSCLHQLMMRCTTVYLLGHVLQGAFLFAMPSKVRFGAEVIALTKETFYDKKIRRQRLQG